MIEFDAWRRATQWPDRPWLMLGKGPTFARRSEHDLGGYNVLGLNHVVREQRVDVAHMIDFEVAESCADVLADHAGVLLMPRYPHLDFRPSRVPLGELLDTVPALAELERRGRVVVYDLDNAVRPSRGPLVHVRYFSSEAALDVLGHLGAREVRTLGIDGGTAYAADFQGMPTRLAGGQPSFTKQFPELRRTARRHGMDLAPLWEPLRVFVGLDESQETAFEVLAHSIQRHASRPVSVEPMSEVETPLPKDKRNRPRTAFSFSRFHIPELAGYRGRAVYLDADMQVFGDIAELWDIPMDGASVLCTNQPDPPDVWKGDPAFAPGRQMSVMMLDCSALTWKVDEIVAGLDEGRYTYEQLMFELCVVPADQIADTLPPVWNHLEQHVPEVTRLTHYTVVPTQPWKNDRNPLRRVWEQGFAEAWRDGAIDPDHLARQIARGHVKPALTALAPDDPALPPPPIPLLAELRAVRAELERHERRAPAAVARRSAASAAHFAGKVKRRLRA